MGQAPWKQMHRAPNVDNGYGMDFLGNKSLSCGVVVKVGVGGLGHYGSGFRSWTTRAAGGCGAAIFSS